MSTPLDTTREPPPGVGQHHATGSVGPVIAVLAVITILGIAAGLIGRLCSGHRVMGYGDYDCEGWLERKCSSCIDGQLGPTPSRTRRQAANVEVAHGERGRREMSQEHETEEEPQEQPEQEGEQREVKEAEQSRKQGSAGS